MKWYKLKTTDLPKWQEKTGCKALIVEYYIYASTIQEAKNQCRKQFKTRVLSVEETN